MSAESILSLLDELPTISGGKRHYTPIVVFGYIGYVDGFEMKMSLYIQPIIPVIPIQLIAPMTLLVMVMLSITVVSFENSFGWWVKIQEDGRKIQERTNTQKIFIFLYIIFYVLVPVLHLTSLSAIYSSRIYAETLIGLSISIYQALIVVNGLSLVITNRIHSLLSEYIV